MIGGGGVCVCVCLSQVCKSNVIWPYANLVEMMNLVLDFVPVFENYTHSPNEDLNSYMFSLLLLF